LRVSDPALDPAGALQILAATLREAGAIALRTFQTPVKSWLKDHASPVCEADIAVDGFLRARLAGPGCGWLSEETADDGSRRLTRRLWIVDPIDGTRSYLAGRPDWVISAALVDDGRPVLAGPKRLVQALAAASSSQIAVAPRLGSLALRLIRVAQGELDVAFASGSSHDWDLAGADLLVHEAGGAMTNLVGRNLTYNQPDLVHGALVAAGAERHVALIALTREWLTEFG
jgi:myo-inositol-1(or 4)-monophosphatase